MNEEIAKINQNISQSNEIEPHIIDIDLIQSHSGKIINLLRNNDENHSEILNSQYYHFKFKEPIYIHTVMFDLVGNTSLFGLEISSTDFKEQETTFSFTKKGTTTWAPYKILKEFKIKPKKNIFKRTEFKQIKLFGFLIEDLDSIKEKVTEVGDYKIKLQEEIAKLENANDDFNSREDRLNELNGLMPELEEQNQKLSDDISVLTTERDSLKENKQHLENNNTQLEEKSKSLNQNISNEEQDLKKLVADKNIFSTEMAEYIKQANKHITTYFLLSLIPWLLILCISILIFNNTADLSTIYNSRDDVDVFTIFLTRLPFALITISILFVAYEISKVFVQNMMKIQSQKRVFAKIGIVAKDVADSSILGIEGLAENDKFELRTKLKMDLLKSHLSNDIGENYEYKIKTSLLNHLPKLGSKKPD